MAPECHGTLPNMWQLLAILFATTPVQATTGITVDGTAFGPQRRLVCSWFTNFENSRLERCRAESGSSPLLSEGASIECVPTICAKLEAEARRVSNWRKREPVWGFFTVEFYGRVSTSARTKRYLGDGTRTVLIERLISVQPRKGGYSAFQTSRTTITRANSADPRNASSHA